MKHRLILALVLISGLSSGQDKMTVDFLPEIKRFDISEVWTLNKIKYKFQNDTNIVERQEPLGYIGENYQRFYIHFISVTQNSMNTLEYYVYGKTRVKTVISSFQGIITITEAKIYNKDESSNIKQGFVKGEYGFYENSGKEETGILKGLFKTDFCIDAVGNITYNALSFTSAGFKNNQFEGTWNNSLVSDSKKCNWGDYRIPDSKDLDIGTDEFSVSEKYIKYGWLTYMIANGMGSDIDGDFAKIENEKWWLGKER